MSVDLEQVDAWTGDMERAREKEDRGPKLPADILAQAAALDAAANGGVDIPGAKNSSVTVQPGISPEKVASDVEGLLLLAVGMLGPMFPKLANVWTPQTCNKVAAAAAPVLIKRGWIPDFGAWGEEVMLCIVVAPLLSPTADALKLQAEPKKPDTPAPVQNKPAGDAPVFIQPASTAPANG